MIPDNKDVTILYQGGSGGFALFYFLLLSEKFVTGLKNKNIQQLIDIQYPDRLATEPRKWKHNEFWPDNNWCKTLPGRKLFLICNPLWNNKIAEQNLKLSEHTHKILLYTDFKLQLRMCWEKQAYWFTDISKKAFNAPSSTGKYLKQIIQTQHNGFDPELERIQKTFYPDQQVDLKDFVSTKHIVNFDPPNSQQLDFLNRWIQLQPTKVKNLLLK
jgi:hypothetical protein